MATFPKGESLLSPENKSRAAESTAGTPLHRSATTGPAPRHVEAGPRGHLWRRHRAAEVPRSYRGEPGAHHSLKKEVEKRGKLPAGSIDMMMQEGGELFGGDAIGDAIGMVMEVVAVQGQGTGAPSGI